MKYKSYSYQAGGVIYTPFIPTAAQAQQAATSSTKTSSTEKPEKISGTMQKEIIDILKSSGIPSDVDLFLTTANSFLAKSQSLSNMSLFGGTDDDYDLSDLITIQKMANDVRFNNERYNKAVANLDAEDAWQDVALDQRGYMWVQEDGELKTVHSSKFNAEKQLALTNEQLLSLRERSSKFAMNQTILNSMSGTIGVKTVQDYLLGLVEKLGHDTLQGYSTKESQDILNGAKLLMNEGPDGFYKITDKQQARNINSAVNYLINQLGKNRGMLTVLQSTIAASGGDPSKDLATMIAEMVHNNADIELKADFDQGGTKHWLEQNGLDASTKDKKVEDTYLSRISAGQGEYVKLGLAPRGSVMDKGGLVVTAVDFGDIVDKQMDVLPQMSLADLRTKAEAFKATFGQDVTFGNQILKPGEDKGILWDGTSHLTGLWLPYTTDAHGQIKPDLELVERYDKMNKEVGNRKLTQTELSSLLQKYHIPATAIDFQTGQLKNTMLFLSFSGYASDGTIDLTDSTKNWTEHLDRSETKGIQELYENVLEYGTTVPGKSTKKLDSGLSGSKRGKFYRGNIYIPIKSPYLGMHMSMNQKVSESIMNNFAQRSSLTTSMNMANNQISGSFIN